jgi:hypothetical protein
MLYRIEVALLIGGIYAIVPAKALSFLVGDGKYQLNEQLHDYLEC